MKRLAHHPAVFLRAAELIAGGGCNGACYAIRHAVDQVVGFNTDPSPYLEAFRLLFGRNEDQSIEVYWFGDPGRQRNRDYRTTALLFMANL